MYTRENIPRHKLLWNRIITASSPRITPQYAPYSQPQPFYRAMFLQRLLSVFRACRNKSA